jgi:hypothetical protein
MRNLMERLGINEEEGMEGEDNEDGLEECGTLSVKAEYAFPEPPKQEREVCWKNLSSNVSGDLDRGPPLHLREETFGFLEQEAVRDLAKKVSSDSYAALRTECSTNLSCQTVEMEDLKKSLSTSIDSSTVESYCLLSSFPVGIMRRFCRWCGLCSTPAPSSQGRPSVTSSPVWSWVGSWRLVPPPPSSWPASAVTRRQQTFYLVCRVSTSVFETALKLLLNPAL